MWEFCLVIFGGLYWIMRWIYETASQEGAQMSIDRRRELREKRKADWMKRATNPQLEEEITRKVSNEETAQQFVDELREAGKELTMIDDGFINSFHITYPNYQFKNNINAIRILLANRGVLREVDAKLGFFNDIPMKIIKNDPPLATKQIEERKDLMLWIDKKLKEHGIEDELCMEMNKLYHLEERLYRYPSKYIYLPASLNDEAIDYPKN